jgi:hypothetical protein
MVCKISSPPFTESTKAPVIAIIYGTVLSGMSVGHRGLLRIASIAVMFVGLVTPGWTRDIYSWSENVAIAPFSGSRQQGETALVMDFSGRVWLSFIDAEYKQIANGNWIAWPRTLWLFVSVDAGKSFSANLIDEWN